MKVKNRKVNLCCRCNSKAGHFIWSTDGRVNPGISAMYKGKICLACYEELKKVYPPVSPKFPKKSCQICGGKIVSFVKGVGDYAGEEYYCEDCGLVVRNG